jgi:hypothetical protein
MKSVRKSNPRSPVQFDWRGNWKKKVVPHLNNPVVQVSLDLGMFMYDPNYMPGDDVPPYSIGRCEGDRIVKGGLSWYRPRGRCHHIALFSMAIGVAIYPDLTWRFVSGDLHTVPVGYDADGNPRVVMDISLFDEMSAEQSIAFAEARRQNAISSHDQILGWFEDHGAAAVRASIAPDARDSQGDGGREASQERAMSMLEKSLLDFACRACRGGGPEEVAIDNE